MVLRSKIARRKWTRILLYWLVSCFSRNLPIYIFRLGLFAAASRVTGYRVYRGIRLTAHYPHRLDALAEIVEALDLIRQADPRRFARIEMCISRIILANLRKCSGYYQWVGRVCGLGKQYPSEHPVGLAVHCYAGAIIHEATHGLLIRKRFPHTRVNKPRIERLCRKEEVRFLVKFPDEARRLVAFCNVTKTRQGRVRG